MSRTHASLVAVALVAALALGTFDPVPAWAEDPQYAVPYLSGGVGKDEREQLDRRSPSKTASRSARMASGSSTFVGEGGAGRSEPIGADRADLVQRFSRNPVAVQATGL